MNGRIRYPNNNTCVREVDPVRHLEASSCRPWPISFREVGGYVYLYRPSPMSGHPGVNWERIAYIPGASVSISGVTSDTPTTATPQQMQSEIKKAYKVTVAGPASGPGWTGTRYAFSGNVFARMTISGTLDVDRQGRARALILTTRLGGMNPYVGTQSLMFSDFGARVTVTPPPADQAMP